MRYSCFLIVVCILCQTEAAYSWQPSGKLRLSSGIGIFDYSGAPPSSLSSHTGIDHIKIQERIAHQIGPYFQLGLKGLFIKNQFSFLLSGEVSHTSTLHSDQEIFSATHTRYNLETGASYQFNLTENLEASLESTLHFSTNLFQDIDLVTGIYKLGYQVGGSFRWHFLKIRASLLVPFWSSYLLSIHKEKVSHSNQSKGLGVRTSLEFKISKKTTFFLESDWERFEVTRLISQIDENQSVLLKPLERDLEKIILRACHFSLGTSIHF